MTKGSIHIYSVLGMSIQDQNYVYYYAYIVCRDFIFVLTCNVRFLHFFCSVDVLIDWYNDLLIDKLHNVKRWVVYWVCVYLTFIDNQFIFLPLPLPPPTSITRRDSTGTTPSSKHEKSPQINSDKRDKNSDSCKKKSKDPILILDITNTTCLYNKYKKYKFRE